MKTYISDCDLLCDNCKAPNDEYVGDEGGGESDSPQHCANCGCPLENPLTSHGVEYVMDKIVCSLEEALEHGRATTWDRIMPKAGTAEETLWYYHGSRHVEILRGWAEQIRPYSLDLNDSAIVNLFLKLSEKPLTPSHQTQTV